MSKIVNKAFVNQQILGVLAADLITGGTLTLSYPTGTTRGDFLNAVGHQFVANQGGYVYAKDFELTLNAANITFTWRNAGTVKAGVTFRLDLRRPGMGPIPADPVTGHVTGVIGGAVDKGNIAGGGVYMMNLGSPATASANAICLAQAIAGAANAVIAGALATAGVATMDVPRAAQMVSSNAGDTTQTVTLTGTDAYGQAMTERKTLNGTTPVIFAKAFNKITQVAVSAVMAGNLTVGTSTTLGLPAFLPAAGYILKELQDGALATAGTTAAGVVVTPTNLTGDVRGTYIPNSAPDGSKAYQIICFLADPGSIGGPQA